jgi:hypothetical protein
MPDTRNPKAVVANGYIFIAGGLFNANGVATTYSAKLNADGTIGSWTALNSLPAPRARHTLTSVNGYMYAIGGVDGSGAAGPTTVYYTKINGDGTIGAWSTAANALPVTRNEASAVVSNGYLYIMGGNLTTSSPQTTVYYSRLNADGSVGTWSTAANPLPATRASTTAVIANGFAYLMGGYNGSAAQSTVYYARLGGTVQIGGNLDLVGLQGQNLADGGDSSAGSTGGSITAGNITAVGTLQVQRTATFAEGVGIAGQLAVNSGLSVGGTSTLFNVDTASTTVQIGSNVADATAVVLVLDTKNTAGDPTGVNGATYYNSNAGKFRCYEGGTWKDCDTGGGGAMLQAAYTSSTGGTTPEIKLDATRGGLDIQDADTTTGASLLNVRATNASGLGSALFSIGNTGAITSRNSADSTAAFDIQNAASGSLFKIDTSNNIVYIGSSTADAVGVVLALDTKNTSADPAGVDGAMYYNSALAQFRCYRDSEWEPCGTKPVDRSYSFNEEFLSGGGTTPSTATSSLIGNLAWLSATIGGITCVSPHVYNITGTVVPTADRPGVMRMITSATATANAGCKIYLGSATNGAGTLALAAGNVIKAAVAPGTATAGSIVMRVGADGQNVATGASTQPTVSGVWWEANPTSNANWQYCYYDGTIATCAASTVAIAANTFARLEIQITATGAGTSAATFRVNGNSYSVSSATINTATLVRPNIMCSTGTGTIASTACYLDYYQMRGDASAAR